MKFKAVKFYQSVLINARQFTHLSTDPKSPNYVSGLEGVSLLDGVGVQIQTSTDHVIVPLNNVASMHVEKLAPKNARGEAEQKADKKK